MNDKQRKVIFPMLKECGCPNDGERRIAWVNGLLFAFGKDKQIASLNDLDETQAKWLAILLNKRLNYGEHE